MSRDRRTHTRAFLFADLRGYSAFTERHGDDAAAELLGRYRRLVRERIAAFEGAEIRTEGDSFYVVFESVGDAVNAALSIRQAALDTDDGRGSRIKVGLGVHAGEARDGDEGIVSSAVNIAARVCAAAQPGEVLVTDTVRALTRTALPIRFVPRGRRRLKGIPEPVGLFRAETLDGPVSVARRPRWSLVVAVVAALIAVVAIAATRGGSAPAGTAPTDGPTAGSPVGAQDTPSADASSDLSRFTDPGEFPNAAEAELRAQLPARIAERCDRADAADTPTFRFTAEEPGGPSTLALRTTAGLDCLIDGVRVQYWQATPARSGVPIGVVSDLFFNTVRRLSLSAGDCAAEGRVHGPWEGGAHDGQVLCYVAVDGAAVIEWTFEEENIYAVARRRDGGTSELYAWWRQTGRLLGR